MEKVKFTPLAQKDFDGYLALAKSNYATMLTDAGMEAEAARTRSEQEFNALLPDGVASPNNYVMAIRETESMVQVGHIWILKTVEGTEPIAYLCDLVVFDEHRQKGFGTAAMRLADQFVRELALPRIKLHVVGKNIRAKDFYERAGYVTTDVFMERAIALPG